MKTPLVNAHRLVLCVGLKLNNALYLQLIAASGDAVTSVGKKIALSAKLLPPEKHKHFGASSGHVYGHEGMLTHIKLLNYLNNEFVDFDSFQIYQFLSIALKTYCLFK